MINQLRAIIAEQPASPQHIGKLAGIEKSAMSRFMRGRSISQDKIERLSDLMGIKLLQTKPLIPSCKQGRPTHALPTHNHQNNPNHDNHPRPTQRL